MAGHFTSAALRRAIGHDSFYSIIADLDPPNFMQWLEMVSVQAGFLEGENVGDYALDTLTYSQSMRETLHWAMVYTFEGPLLEQARGSSGGLFGYYVRLHPTAFRANGACELSPVGMARVMFNTRASMVRAQNIAWLAQGMTERYEAAIRGANTVRKTRAARGLPVTIDGYREPNRSSPLGRALARQRSHAAMTR